MNIFSLILIVFSITYIYLGIYDFFLDKASLVQVSKVMQPHSRSGIM